MAQKLASAALTYPNLKMPAFTLNKDSLAAIRVRLGIKDYNSAIKILSTLNPYGRSIPAFHHSENKRIDEYIELKQIGNIDTIKESFFKCIKNA